jgi:amino acid adenylation domain-containing protein
MHHIISDGWSMALFTSELTALYQAYISGKPSPLPELEIQYADFSLWQRTYIGDVLNEQLAYWEKQLADAPPLLTLPTDHPRPAVQSYRGDYLSFTLPKELTKSLKQLSQQQSCTLFMTLQAAFALLLSRYSGLDDILVGTPIANRQQKEIEPLIGFFVNTLVLRNDLSGNPTFLEFLRSVRQVALDAYQHQALPFERLVESLQPERTLSQNPIFQVMFDMQNTRQSHFELELVTVTPLEVPESTAKFDLSLSMEEEEESLSLMGWWEYSTDLFEEATISRMASHFQTLLEAIVANPSQPIGHLPLLTEAERHQLLREWNDTLWPSAGVDRVKLPGGIQIDDPFDKCFHQLFEEQVERTPEAIAALFENQQLTYSELNTRANHLSRILVESGVEAEKIVGLLGERNLDFLTGILAIFKAGGVYLPLDPFLPVERLSHMMKQSQATLILASKTKRVEQRLSEIKGRGEIQVLWLDQQPTLSDNPCSPPFSDNPCSPRCGPNNLAYIIFTSGSTGLPKGAMIEHKGMLNHLYAIWLDFELTSRDTVAQNASQCFDISVWQFLLPLIVGGRVHIFSNEVARDPEELLAQVAANGITILEVVPSLLRVMLESNVEHDPSTCSGHRLSKLRWLIPTGEALPPELSRQWFKRYPDIPMMNAYGPAECADDVTFYPLYEPPAPDVVNMPIGRPVINMQMYILDPHLQPVPIGVAGELYIGGIGVGRGYLHDAQRTKQAFMNDPFGRPPPSPLTPLKRTPRSKPTLGEGEGVRAGRLYKTGDWGRYLPDGNIEFLGRIDHQVKIRGFRIELGEIEAALTQHPKVQEAVVIVREEGGKRLVAYLVTSGAGMLRKEPVNNHELRRHLSVKLPATMIPSAFVQLEAMPLTPNGKIDRRKFPVPDSSSLALTGTYLPPRNSTEQQLVHIWQEVLGLHSVGVRENFFDLGGHSLLAVRLMALIQQHFGVNLALATLFQNPTIEQLATRLAEPSHLVSYVGKSDWSSLVPIQPNGEKPPFFCVPGIGGNVLYFYDLARRMYAEQPFYGLQSVGLDGETAPYSTAEEVAAHYIKAIQSIQPEGPYLLGGHSLGGEIIFEMAQQLAKAGHDVARLMIFDTSAPIPRPEPSEATWDDAQWLIELSEAIGASIGQASELDYDSLLLLDPEEQLIRFQDELKRLDFPVGSALNQVRGWLQVFKSNSLIHYVPQDVIPMPITLFQAEEAPSIDGERDKQEALRREEPTWGWNQFANGPVEVISVPGNHMTMMTPPHIEVLVERLVASLEQAVEKS